MVEGHQRSIGSPSSFFEWSCGPSLADASRATLVSTLQERLGLYDALPEVQAYDEVASEPPKKQARMVLVRRWISLLRAPAWCSQHQAITTLVCKHGISEMLEAAQQHLQHHGWKACARSEVLLAGKLIYPDVMSDSDYTNGATTSATAVNETWRCPAGHSPRVMTALPTAKRPPGLCAARRTVQWWEPTGRDFLSQSLSQEDFAEAEGTVLRTGMLDQEVSSLMLRRPSVFFASMRPLLAFQLDTTSTLAHEARAASAAAQAAASARSTRFKSDYAKNPRTIQSFTTGALDLRAFLHWTVTGDKRAEAKRGVALVREHMAKAWQFLMVDQRRHCVDVRGTTSRRCPTLRSSWKSTRDAPTTASGPMM